ncbi:MAG: MFS transporter [Candidatus Pacearchaeota archaeon]|nr:MFS transporter [Candidatus Pacearchaeota archaeon]
MNRTLKLLIFSDIFVLTGFALISPILAIFIKENLVGGSIAAVGIAAAITTFLRCLLQLLFAYIAKPQHRFAMVVVGTGFIAIVPFIYFFSTHVIHIYIAAAVHGFGAGLANPAWFSLFANNLARGKKGWEWSIYSSSVGIGTATAAFVGSQLASRFGFAPVFIVVGILALIGCGILLGLSKNKRDHKTKTVSAKTKLH